eukprot:249037-Karenia_brevis.AAC.1
MRRARRLVEKSERPSLSKGVLTAQELLEYCRGRKPPVKFHDIELVVLENFIAGHDHKKRAFVAI